MSAAWFGRRKIETVIKSGDPTFAASSGFGGELKGGGFLASALPFLFCACCSAGCLTLLPAEGEVRKPAGGPQLHISAAYSLATARDEHHGRPHLWLLSGLRGLSWPSHPASLFHVNNKYSHRRPRLVYARRLPILRPRPFTPRGAGSSGRDRARDGQ